jgi:2-dehydropantoate 2-reductase
MELPASASHLNGKSLAPGASAGAKVLVFGAGAIGTYIGGSLALAGEQVVFVEQPRVVEELRQRGLRLDLTLDRRRALKGASRVNPASFVIVSSLEEALRYGPFDVALFALKSFDTPAALEGIKPYADKMPPVLCLSNGVSNEPAIAHALGPDKVIYGSVTSAIGRRGAGDIVLERLRGLGIAKGHPLSEKLNAAFNQAYLNSRLFDDAHSMKWSKMLTNLLANPTSAILDMTARQVFANKDLYKLEVEMLRECLAVMQAQGLKVVDLPGTPVRALAFATKLPLWLSRPLLGRAAGAGRGTKMPSFHIDLHSGRGKSEVEYLHGEVVRAGEKCNTPTPVNKVLTETLMALTNKDIPLEQFAHKPEKLLAKINNAQAAVPGGTATRHLRDAAGSGKNREKKDERTD